MVIGPVQIVVVAFDNDDNFRGQIRQELDAIRGRGVIKLIDLLFVRKTAAGELQALSDSDLTAEDEAVYGAALQRLLGQSGAGPEAAPGSVGAYGFSASQVRAAIEALPNGTALGLMLFEHSWAAGFAAAIREAGGHLVTQGILTRDAVMLMGAELAAAAEAEAAIEAAQAIKGAALLDALAFTAELEQAEQALVARMEAIAPTLVTGVAAEALRTLTLAGLIDESEVEPAIAALVGAGLVDPGVVAEAVAATDAAEREVAELAAAQVGRA